MEKATTRREPEHDDENVQCTDFGYEIHREPAENMKFPVRFGLARSLSYEFAVVLRPLAS